MGQFFKMILTEDTANTVFDPIRVGWMIGLVVYLAAGVALIAFGVHALWVLKTPPDYQSFGIGIAAWGGGFGAYVAGGGAGLMMKSKGDAATTKAESEAGTAP